MNDKCPVVARTSSCGRVYSYSPNTLHQDLTCLLLRAVGAVGIIMGVFSLCFSFFFCLLLFSLCWGCSFLTSGFAVPWCLSLSIKSFSRASALSRTLPLAVALVRTVTSFVLSPVGGRLAFFSFLLDSVLAEFPLPSCKIIGQITGSLRRCPMQSKPHCCP